MKRISVLSLAVMLVFALFATQAMAKAINITTTDMRATQGGVCEEVGAITFTTDDGTVFDKSTITIELLVKGVICKDSPIIASYDASGNYIAGAKYDADGIDIIPAPGAAYTVSGRVGNNVNDFYTIVLRGGDFSTFTVGNDPDRKLCLDLSNTPYDSSDPTRQRVLVTFRDDLNNTYSGDDYVATVKDSSPHPVTVCAKDKGDNVVKAATGISNWSTSVEQKSNLVKIPLCDPINSQAQNSSCGVDNTVQEKICLTIGDTVPSNFKADDKYEIQIGKTTGAKTGVGIKSAQVYYTASDGTVTINPMNMAKAWKDDGTAIPIPTKSTNYILTSKAAFTMLSQGAGTYYIVLDIVYNSCKATAGDYIIDVSGRRLPCGDSFSVPNLHVAKFVACNASSAPTVSASYIFPYAPNFLGKDGSVSGWWSGLVITNPGSAPLKVNVNIYEEDGQMYTGQINVVANGVLNGLTQNVITNIATTTDDAVFGDESFWMEASSSSPFYGFIFIAMSTDMAQGYLPIAK